MGGAAIAEGEVPSIYEKHFGRAWAGAGVARFIEAASIRSRAGEYSKRKSALPVSFALGGVGALSGCVGQRQHSRQGWIDNRHRRRRVFLWTGRSSPARERGRGRFCLLCDRR